MTNWQEYGEALVTALTHEIAARGTVDREAAFARAEEGLGECSRALDLATSPAGERLAMEHGDRLAALIVDYLENGAEAWPAALDRARKGGFGEAFMAGLERGKAASKPASRAESAELFGKAAALLAEAAVAARSDTWRRYARLAHRHAALGVERAGDPEGWALPGLLGTMVLARGEADRLDRESLAGSGISV